MKTLHLAIIVIFIITTIIIGIFMIEFNQKSSTISLETNPTNNSTSPNVSTIIIPKGSEEQSSGTNYEPRYLTVVIGVNNTVRWINEADVGNTIVSETYNQPDPFFEKGPYSHGVILPGKSFNFTFTKPGEYQYNTEPHPWLYGWVLVLPQSLENVTQTVIVSDKRIPGPCEIFSLPCPINYSFTAQKFGPDVYIEKITTNGVDRHVVIHPFGLCVYPSDDIHETCKNPDDLTILELDGINTSTSQEDAKEKFNATTQQVPGTIPVMYQNMTNVGDSIGCNITGDNYVRNATLDNSSDAIILSTYTTEDGNLTVTLTPNLLNLIEKGTPFIVLTNGQEVKYKEYMDNQNMIMTIPFHSGTKVIEIITTEIV
ncbi:MAG: cupredoxin domain-containing protein [Nitrosotalea sp.]